MTTMTIIKNKQRVITAKFIALSICKYTVHLKILTFMQNEWSLESKT